MKSKTVYEVAKEYAEEREEYEDVKNELLHLRELKALGEIDDIEFRKRQITLFNKFFNIPPERTSKQKPGRPPKKEGQDKITWRYYSILDSSMSEILESGRNSDSIEQAIESGISFISEFLKDKQRIQIKSLSLLEKAELIESDNYVIIGHDKKADAATDGIKRIHYGRISVKEEKREKNDTRNNKVHGRLRND